METVIWSEPAATELALWRASAADWVSPSADRRISSTAPATTSTTRETSEAMFTCAVTIAQVSIGPTYAPSGPLIAETRSSRISGPSLILVVWGSRLASASMFR